MKKLAIIIIEESTPNGRVVSKEFIGDNELLTDLLEWCLDELRSDINQRRAKKCN
jgi:hypothetical protein